MLERVRAMCKAFYGQERQRKALLDLSRRLEVTYMVVDLDNSNKWKATSTMLEKLLRGEALLANFFVAHGATFPAEGVLSDSHFTLAREIYGCLLPVQNASLLLEKDGFMGSSVLPLLSAAARGLAAGAPVQVPQRGQVGQLADVEEAGLSAPARAFRAQLREELEADQRHLAQSRASLLLASSLDPRWRGLHFASAADKASTRAALVEEAVRVASAGPREPKRRRLRRIEDPPPAPLRVPGMERLLANLAEAQAAPEAPGVGEDLQEEVAAAVDAWLGARAEPQSADPLAIWAKVAAGSPAHRFLAPLARKYLAAPGGSGSIERLWSEGRRVLAWNRHALSDTRVSQLLRLKFNMAQLGEWPPRPSEE